MVKERRWGPQAQSADYMVGRPGVGPTDLVWAFVLLASCSGGPSFLHFDTCRVLIRRNIVSGLNPTTLLQNWLKITCTHSRTPSVEFVNKSFYPSIYSTF